MIKFNYCFGYSMKNHIERLINYANLFIFLLIRFLVECNVKILEKEKICDIFSL